MIYTTYEATKDVKAHTYLLKTESGWNWVTKDSLCEGCVIDLTHERENHMDYYGSFTYYSYHYVTENLFNKLSKYNYSFVRFDFESDEDFGLYGVVSKVTDKAVQIKVRVQFGKSEPKDVFFYVPKSALKK